MVFWELTNGDIFGLKVNIDLSFGAVNFFYGCRSVCVISNKNFKGVNKILPSWHLKAIALKNFQLVGSNYIIRSFVFPSLQSHQSWFPRVYWSYYTMSHGRFFSITAKWFNFTGRKKWNLAIIEAEHCRFQDRQTVAEWTV